jgi:hypothetical protein
VLVLGYWGLRFGEAAALRVGDVNLRARRIRVSRSVTYVTGQGLIEGSTKTVAAVGWPEGENPSGYLTRPRWWWWWSVSRCSGDWQELPDYLTKPRRVAGACQSILHKCSSERVIVAPGGGRWTTRRRGADPLSSGVRLARRRRLRQSGCPRRRRSSGPSAEAASAKGVAAVSDTRRLMSDRQYP